MIENIEKLAHEYDGLTDWVKIDNNKRLLVQFLSTQVRNEFIEALASGGFNCNYASLAGRRTVLISFPIEDKLNKVAKEMKKFAWEVSIDYEKGKIYCRDLTITYEAFDDWWENNGWADFEVQSVVPRSNKTVILSHVDRGGCNK